MVGEKEKAEMDSKKEEMEKEERKNEVLDLVEGSQRTDSGVESGLDLDGVLDMFKEDIADFGNTRLKDKIYNSKDSLQKARGMMEYFLAQEKQKQILKLNMRSTSMLSEDGWHFFAELYGDVYVTQVMTLQEILKRFYHYVSVLEEDEMEMLMSLPQALLAKDLANADSVYRQLIGLYHMKKKKDDMVGLSFKWKDQVLVVHMKFGKRVERMEIELEFGEE